MGWLKDVRARPWLIAVSAVGALLVAITFAGITSLILNERVGRVTEEALEYDVALEEEGNDLRVAVLEVRHYHRELLLDGPSRGGIADFEESYALLREEIDELEDLGVRAPETPQPEQLRGMAEDYYAEFRPAVELYGDGPKPSDTFTQASDRGLTRLTEFENAAWEIHQLGEQRAAAALRSVEQVSNTERLTLFAVNGGLLLVGGALAYVVVRMLGVLSSLHAREQAMAEQLARSSQSKTDFIADASHELRTPLTVLRGNAELGLAVDPGWAHRELLEEVVGESNRMSRMVEDLLLLARSDSESLPLLPEEVPAQLFLADLVGRAEGLVRECGASLEADVSGEGKLRIDRARSEQAVLILVDNAAKYGPDGALVTLSSFVEDSGELRITVEDEGPGIPEEDLPWIFERFYRVDKARSRQQGGTGLGLPIAKTIAEAQGGRIEAESQTGQGTRMSLYLPLTAGAEHNGRASEKHPGYG